MWQLIDGGDTHAQSLVHDGHFVWTQKAGGGVRVSRFFDSANTENQQIGITLNHAILNTV